MLTFLFKCPFELSRVPLTTQEMHFQKIMFSSLTHVSLFPKIFTFPLAILICNELYPSRHLPAQS